MLTEPIATVTKISRYNNYVHSVSKETHHEFIGFPCDPGSRSSDPGQVIFDHWDLKHRQNEIHYEVHLSALNPKRNATFHSAFLSRPSVIYKPGFQEIINS